MAKKKEVKFGICSKCNRERELVKARWCKECKNKYENIRRAGLNNEKKEEMKRKERERYQRIKANVIDFEVDETESKICSMCNKEKSLAEFHLAKNKGNIRAACKSCLSSARKEYYQKNKEKIIKQTSEYKNNKIKNDPVFKLERRLRCRIYHAFVKQNKKKEERTMKYIDCTKAFLKEWIEFQLDKGMTLENYGEYWHIDHVKPCASYDLSKEDEIRECFCWKNLRPLKGDENLSKSDKVCEKTIKKHQKKVEQFLEHLNEKRSEKHPS